MTLKTTALAGSNNLSSYFIISNFDKLGDFMLKSLINALEQLALADQYIGICAGKALDRVVNNKFAMFGSFLMLSGAGIAYGLRVMNQYNLPFSFREQQATKRVKFSFFNPIDEVRIIPNRKEYEENRLIEDLWWSKDDEDKFKEEANLEILMLIADEFLSTKHFINKEEARNYLYQPDSETEAYKNSFTPSMNGLD